MLDIMSLDTETNGDNNGSVDQYKSVQIQPMSVIYKFTHTPLSQIYPFILL